MKTTPKKSAIERSIIPGNSKSLWNTVNIAKNKYISHLPPIMYLNKIQIPGEDLPDTFATYFKDKINKIVNETHMCS